MQGRVAIAEADRVVVGGADRRSEPGEFGERGIGSLQDELFRDGGRALVLGIEEGEIECRAVSLVFCLDRGAKINQESRFGDHQPVGGDVKDCPSVLTRTVDVLGIEDRADHVGAGAESGFGRCCSRGVSHEGIGSPVHKHSGSGKLLSVDGVAERSFSRRVPDIGFGTQDDQYFRYLGVASHDCVVEGEKPLSILHVELFLVSVEFLYRRDVAGDDKIAEGYILRGRGARAGCSQQHRRQCGNNSQSSALFYPYHSSTSPWSFM